jgi:hypothetical protein
LTLFRTKLPPPALLEALLLEAPALVSLLDEPLPRCRQPVALVEPAVAPVDDCGVDVVGLCAARVPHKRTAVLSVTAHCLWLLLFMSVLLHICRDWSARPELCHSRLPARCPCKGWSTTGASARESGFRFAAAIRQRLDLRVRVPS